MCVCVCVCVCVCEGLSVFVCVYMICKCRNENCMNVSVCVCVCRTGVHKYPGRACPGGNFYIGGFIPPPFPALPIFFIIRLIKIMFIKRKARRDKTMADKFMYIPNENTQNEPFF